MKHDPRGSTWRRWDLHFHTPSSFDYQNKGLKPADLAAGLIASGIEVVAVTDHHVVDATCIRAMQVHAPDKLMVLPGIELRTELGGKNSVHIIGIFHEDVDLKELWTKLQGKLNMSPADVKLAGDEAFYVPYDKACRVIHELGGLVSVHAGKKTNGIEEIGNAAEFKQAFKTKLLRDRIDILEIGRVSDREAYRSIVFPEIGKVLPMVMCSDNHDIGKYAAKNPLWIKADPGFLGLVQIVNEPDSRTCLDLQPASVIRVAQNANRYISQVSFTRDENYGGPGEWFSGSLPLNHGLVAVIGNKGGGKSALADILALLGDTRTPNAFSFLNKDRFLNPKDRLGSVFSAEIGWAAGPGITRALGDRVDATAPETVKYIPQNYLESVCSELKESSDTQFDRELKEVIFSHVSDSDRLKCDSLDQLIALLTQGSEERIRQVVRDLSMANREIAALQVLLEPEVGEGLRAQLVRRQSDLTVHDQAKPKEVLQPEQDDVARAVSTALEMRLGEIALASADHESHLAASRADDKEAAVMSAACERLTVAVQNFQRQHQTVLFEVLPDAKLAGVDLSAVLRLEVNVAPIEAAKLSADARRVQAARQLDPSVEGSHAALLAALKTEATQLRSKLGEPGQRYQAYLESLAAWQERRKVIEGAEDAPGSVVGLTKRLEDLKGVPDQISALEIKREQLAQEIYAAKQQLLVKYQTLYSPVQTFIDERKISGPKGALQFQASIAVDGLAEQFLELLHQGRRGSFAGEVEGRAKIVEIASAVDFTAPDGAMSFIHIVLDHLKNDFRDTPPTPVKLADQLRQGVSVDRVYDFLFAMSYLKPRFELRWQGKTLDSLSPGERGNLLLLFYLLIDKREVPLVIDQPEENLDNQTIATVLVPSMKSAKERRQVIMVTHNPNLAVVCDADQVIHASMDKVNGNRVSYTSGAIENPVINGLIVDVLEGTKPAFSLRDLKYRLDNYVPSTKADDSF